ncbi:hypothetical protein PCC9214_04297 [Planktothrix tepida]|uniref:Uncharacterized protein n=2 Tax=Planktothrix TaxID=54304 RepID=A0A1J1LTT1_9CYAN|nr:MULTISPECIES: hypothetical protein [Planktothrix]CAD5931860.1 hypothetical protein NO713_01341 [Planktothrix pseudagardhii]CAD5977550.1 hypothetical protein PCC9214_04297 [Planktothrix tepida]CUR35997.1 conserved hypothetical protein [Planktothrix tepida PCC 9214]
MDEKTPPAIVRPKPALEIQLTPAGSEKSIRPSRPHSDSDRNKPSFSKPRRVDHTPPKPWVELEEAQNATGDVFHLGDLIQVRAPWGEIAIAQIDHFYEVAPGSLWAQFVPTEEREEWTWKGGSIRAELLKKA